MATKSKSFKYNPLIKLVAVLLTITFAFFTGVNALAFVRKGIYYASTDGEFKNTPIFASEIIHDVYSLAFLKDKVDSYNRDLTYEQYLKTDDAKKVVSNLNKKEERAIKLFNTIQELKKLRPNTIETKHGSYDIDENGVVYFSEDDLYISANEFYDYYNSYYYDGEYTEQVTSVAIYDYEGEKVDYPPNDEELFKIKDSYTSYSEWSYKYQQLRSAIFDIVDDATSVEQIKRSFDASKNETLEEAYYLSTERVTEALEDFVNVDFILKSNKTGKFISTMDEAEHKGFINELYDNSLYTIEFDGKKLYSEPQKINKSTNLLKFLTDAYLLQGKAVDEEWLLSELEGYTLYLKIDRISTLNTPGDEYYNMYRAWNNLPEADADVFVITTILSALLSIACFITCCFMAGKKQDGSIKLAITDHIPFVIYLAFTILLIGSTGFGIGTLAYMDFIEPEEIFQNYANLQLLLTPEFIQRAIGAGFALVSLFLLSFVLYIVRNIKAHSLAFRFIVYNIFFKADILIHNAKKRIAENQAKKKALPPEQIKRQIKRQTIIPVIVYVAMNLFLYVVSFSDAYPVAVIALIIFNSLAVVYTMLYLSDVLRLMRIAEETRNGNYNSKINPKSFVAPLRKFAQDLEACREGIENAINEAIKGEHLKTELITNVSHDLKTPLTSIINYVSLLKLENTSEEEKLQYIDILDEKSKKLKRLIEDLTEASKASSGNVKMNLSQVNLNELALQAVGENSDVLESVGLDVILTEKDNDIVVNADSQHTFRIIDNLFSNAKKYSLTGTRVYVDVYKENGCGVFEIKNISREKLNINPDELTERFVRGDNSRTTDGSGLGLSIAQSFAELQNGTFNIEIDGDMFKAVVKLPLV